MSKICIANCVKDARIPVRATYVNLYKWPESDAEFMRSAAAHGGARPRSTLTADSISCRQIYLRSYKFSRKETVPGRMMRCFGKVRVRVAAEMPRKRRRRRRRCLLARRAKEFSRAALFAIFRRLLSCTSSVDVADNGVN